jgi:ABC-type bacteriocin/lantibiotic exporter with double-glycine peptidase domain
VPRFLSRTLAPLLLACCAAWGSDAKGIWIDVPFVPQQKDGCGAASIAMVMQYWQQSNAQSIHTNADPDQILRAIRSNEAHGIYAADMVHYFEQNGFRTFEFAGERADIERHLAKGRPLIAAIKPASGLPLHYVVVAGIDPEEHIVLLNDPAQRKLLKEGDARFDEEWKAAGNWTLLALPRTSAH